MKESIHSYLIYLDKVLDCVPKNDMVLRKELIDTNYCLLVSKEILSDFQYLDYLFYRMLENQYISYVMFLKLGGFMEKIIYGLKVRN